MENNETIEIKENDKFLLCECSCEILLVQKDDDGINLSIYSKGNFISKPNIFQRLKYCWYHLTTGEQFYDQFILSKQKARELSEWLLNNSN